MPYFKNILFPTDFSDCAAHAQKYAFALVKASGGTLHAIHVIDPGYLTYVGTDFAGVTVDRTMDSIEAHAKAGLARLAQEAQDHGLNVDTHLMSGPPDLKAAEKAAELGCGLIVVGTHGRTGFDRLVFGSTCEKLIRASRIPVLAIKDPEHEFVKGDEPINLKRVLCPCDFSEFSHAAIPVAASLCREFDATLILMHVVDARLDYPEILPGIEKTNSPHLHDKAVEMLNAEVDKYPDLETQVEVVTGVPHRELAKTVDTEDINLIVIATHGRTGIVHALLGSTAERLVRIAPCPILTVRPKDNADPA